MIKKLDIYIAKKFLGTVAFMLILSGVVSTIFDISEKMEDFLKHNLSLKTVVFDYYLAFVPNIINLISPLLIFISALYFTARMANNSEIVAILASGVSYYRIVATYLVVAFFIGLVDLGLKNFIIPMAYDKVNQFEQKYSQTGYYYSYRNIHRQIDKNTYFYIQSFEVHSNSAYKFTIEKYKDNKLTSRLYAEDARYDTLQGDWRLNRWIKRSISNGKEQLSFGDSMRIKIPITHKEFQQKIRNAPALTTPELIKFIQEEKYRGEAAINFYLIELNKRFSLPFAVIILVLIAVSIASRKIRGGIGSHLLLGILIAVSYELLMRFSTTFSTNANLPPVVSVWIPNALYLCLGLWLLKRSPK